MDNKLPRPGVISDAQRLDWLARHGDVTATTGFKPADGVFSHFTWGALDADGQPNAQTLREAIDAMMRSR